jgi:hypothetical protein
LSGIRVDSRVNFGVRHPQSCHPTLGRRVSFIEHAQSRNEPYL